MYTLTVVAEDRGLGESKVKLKEIVGRDGKNKIAEVLEEFKEQLDGFDGRYTGGSMSIELEADAKLFLRSFTESQTPCSNQLSKQLINCWLKARRSHPSQRGLHQLSQCQSQTVPLDSVLIIERSMQ